VTEDQRFAAWRPDVLVYKTEPLEDDLTLAGPLLADLWVATSGTASDFIVKLIDVYPGKVPGFDPDDRGADEKTRRRNPGGRQMLVRAEVMRGRFRSSYEKPEPFTPNEPTKVSFELLDVLHTFKRGHRVMVQVQSTWFPFVDRNPQKYVPNIFEAAEDDFIKVTNRVYRSATHPSRLRVGVLE
jgi:putative CocE/NonD family hydrolase